MLSRQCLSRRRIPDEETLVREIETWEVERNERGETFVALHGSRRPVEAVSSLPSTTIVVEY